MNTLEPVPPRRRLQELLAIPERQRTDAEWDEINELEIKLASANRETSPEQGARRDTPATNNNPRRNRPGGGQPGGGQPGRKPPRKFHK